MLEYINLSIFDSKKVITTQAMFYDCEELKEADLSNFNTENMERIINIFYGCGQLEKVNFSKSNASKADLNGIFAKWKKLKKECVITKDKTIIKEFIKELDWRK